jgi:hypothetical protein
VDVASYVTGKEGGDSDSDDNLQWLKHGPCDENQTLGPTVGCQGHFRVGERDRAVATVLLVHLRMRRQ